MARSLHRRLNSLRARPLVGWVVALALLAGLGYRRLLLWDPSAPGLPDVGWFFFGVNDPAPQIVFAITALLLYRRREMLAGALGRKGSPLPALPLLGAGVALFLWAHYVDAPDLLLISFPPFCLGSALLLFGARLTGAMTFPILYLAFAIPIPGVLTNHIVFPLQLWNAAHVAQLLNAVGIPAVQQGDMLYLASRSFEVIETCSGFRSIIVLNMLAVALCCYFPARRVHLALLVASASVIAGCMNAARILTLALWPEAERSATHAVQGVVVFIIGSAVVYGVDVTLRRWWGERGSPAKASDPALTTGEGAQSGKVGHAMALAVLLVLMLGASIWMPRWTPPKSRELARVELPQQLGDWEAIDTLKPELHYLGSVRVQKWRYRLYQRGGETVAVFLGYEDRLSRSRSLLSPKNTFPGRGWETEERGVVEFGPEGFPVAVVAARSQARRMLSYHWYQGVEGLGEEVARAWLATDRSFLRRPTGALLIRLSTGVSPSPQDRSRAEARLGELAELLLARFADFGGPARDRPKLSP